MSKDNMTLTISAKDLASATFQRVKASGIAMGVAIGNLASKAVVGMVNGLRGWVNEALEAEKANVMLDAALRGSGQYTADLSKKYRDLANAIQDETGASDESVKSNIALLVSMGVLPQKMDAAARGIQALSALNIEGSMAARAISRALNGDIAAFDRLSPEVRNATTITEKYAAANKLLEAGYAQQKANLQTVGGAWQALKGRIGDAREEIIGAIFEGLKLGKTFDSMQSSVGAFLKSESFKNFTDRLRDGAAFAKDILKSLTTKGQFSETMSDLGDLIVAAFIEGADHVGKRIEKAFAWLKPGDLNKDFHFDPKFRSVGGGYGLDNANPIDTTAIKEVAEKAPRTLKEIVDDMRKRFENNRRVQEIIDMAKENEAESAKEASIAAGESVSNQDALNDGKKKAVALENAKLQLEMRAISEKHYQEDLEEQRTDVEKERLRISENAKDLEDRANQIAKDGVAKWLSDAKAGRENDKTFMRGENKASKNVDRLRAALARNGKLSAADMQIVKDDDARKAQGQALMDAANQAKLDAFNLDKRQKEIDTAQKQSRDRQEGYLKKIAEKIEVVLTDGGN